ncbi:uncharacterized protein CC84DRAFT_1262193 [Paraphaeosphaeria sporulosa]|uniref:Uncharacterized protein n=1 Tax=Paraphaeosphaeria sporulosa TaxID=1460663 RepID=A0A177C5P0_9PLEO|nr:uncharacterized protein CC84DRAFT_1262193 [Paraphaeosphaeria sporulosa]OAG02199.1 hypothetical protein CC84DRAFT_1262193 [Paraphaeosphaeria sporulosa]
MAQGAVKPRKASNAPKKPTGPQRGNRVIKPKKASLASQQKIKHKASSQLTGKTEKLLAEKAGHLELLKGERGRAESAGRRSIRRVRQRRSEDEGRFAGLMDVMACEKSTSDVRC